MTPGTLGHPFSRKFLTVWLGYIEQLLICPIIQSIAKLNDEKGLINRVRVMQGLEPSARSRFRGHVRITHVRDLVSEF